jgi:hypothetical protein
MPGPEPRQIELTERERSELENLLRAHRTGQTLSCTSSHFGSGRSDRIAHAVLTSLYNALGIFRRWVETNDDWGYAEV